MIDAYDLVCIYEYSTGTLKSSSVAISKQTLVQTLVQIHEITNDFSVVVDTQDA